MIADNMPVILEVQHVSKSFGQLKAVDDVSFKVDKGEIFGIAGPNGAGKTTLFNVISASPFRSDTGRISFCGETIHHMAPHRIFRRGLARTFQRETVFDSLSVVENVLVAAHYSGRTTPQKESLKTLEIVGLASQSAEEAGTLSLFDKKRLMLASALVAQPSLLMLDEPASGLNRAETDYFAGLFRSLQAEGMTILLIEHVLPLLLSLSERLMILDHGQKLTEGSPDEVVGEKRVIEAYLGKGLCHA